MADPKTVREWLEKLPQIEDIPDWRNVSSIGIPCDSLAAAVTHVYMQCDSRDENFWLGVSSYVDGDDFPPDVLHDIIKGYTAAKAAFEAQQLPEPESPTFTGKIVSPVGYIAVAPDDHAELVRKADLYNDLKAVIDRLDCEIQDIKKLFV